MKKVLITGVSMGIGNATAKLLAREDYFIVGTYNSHEEEAKALLAEIKNAELFKVDFSNRTETVEFLEKIKSEQFSAVINNAGVILFEKWDELKMETWDKTMEINVNTPLLIAHTLRNSIEEKGTIINISSTDGLKGSIASIAYSASKAALTSLSYSLANVFGPKKIRVISLSPGWIGDGMGSPVIEDAKWMNPMGRTAEYQEIANAVSLLLSDKASFINGTNIIVDGGSLAVDYCLKKENELT